MVGDLLSVHIDESLGRPAVRRFSPVNSFFFYATSMTAGIFVSIFILAWAVCSSSSSHRVTTCSSFLILSSTEHKIITVYCGLIIENLCIKNINSERTLISLNEFLETSDPLLLIIHGYYSSHADEDT